MGDWVAVRDPHDWSRSDSCWIGRVIHAEGGARNADNALFQIACIDSGVIRTMNADTVLGIVQRSGALEPAHDHAHQHQRASQGNQQSNRDGRTGHSNADEQA